jgi:probable phosphoglycerate mutase
VLGVEVETEPGFQETDFGDWEGYTFGEVREKWPAEMDAWLSSTAVAPPHGESFDATAVRVRQARDRLIASYGGSTVVVVSHVTPIKTMLRMALDAPAASIYRMHLDLACRSTVQWFADGPAVVRSMNETHYLAAVAPGE